MKPIGTGTLFHGIELLHYCGGGGYGDVYFGRDISGRKLAVKIVSKAKIGPSWKRELKGVVNYRKVAPKAPGLVEIFHVEEDDECFFYTMEAADSASPGKYDPDTLARRLRHGPLPETEMLNVLERIFDGIKTLHRAGFAHRDVKPDNILFIGGKPKLGDIGLLSAMSSTMTQIAGTMEFLPPEIRSGETESASDFSSCRKNDFYAFGKVIYCAATGNEPRAWPAIPPGLKLSVALKWLLRLAFRLCDRDSVRRLDDIDGIEKEFLSIRRKIVSGENFRDRIAYHAGRIFSALKSAFVHTARTIGRHWVLSLVLAACATGAFFLPRPAALSPARGIDMGDYHTFHSEKFNFSMEIPREWEVVSSETVRKLFLESHGDELFGRTSVSPVQKKILEISDAVLQHGGEYIFCDFDEKLYDSIAVGAVPSPVDDIFKMTPEEIRLNIQQRFQGTFGYRMQIYDLRRITFAGCPCVVADVSPEPGKNRILDYSILHGDRRFHVTLTAKHETFATRRAQFERALKTLKFDGKP